MHKAHKGTGNNTRVIQEALSKINTLKVVTANQEELIHASNIMCVPHGNRFLYLI
jgi:hypothetical protein